MTGGKEELRKGVRKREKMQDRTESISVSSMQCTHTDKSQH